MNHARWILSLAALAALVPVACGNSSASNGTTSPEGGAQSDDDGSAAKPGSDGGGDDDATSSQGDDDNSGDDDGGTAKNPGVDAAIGPLLTCSNAAALTTVDAGAATGVVTGMVAGPGTFVGGCQIFPADNAWNVDVSSQSIPTTTSYTGIPQGTSLHPDFGGWSKTGGGPYGIPLNEVPSGQPNATINLTLYADESDPGPAGWTSTPKNGKGTTAYPIPNVAKIEGDPATGKKSGDDHLLVLQQGATCGAPCTLWETWSTVGGVTAPWSAANGAKWDLGSNDLRKAGWTSGDAAGLSVYAGLVRIAEVKAGVVTHAIRVTFNTTQAGYILPATHYAGSSALGGSDPPMGLRLRLKSGTDTTKFSGPGLIIATAMKTYGLIVADIGSDWYFQGDSDDGWNAQDKSDTYLGEVASDFGKITGADFEVLVTGTPSAAGE